MSKKPFTIVYFKKAVPGVNKYAGAPENKQMPEIPGGCIIRQGKETVIVISQERKPSVHVFIFFVRNKPEKGIPFGATVWELTKKNVPDKLRKLCFDRIDKQINAHDKQNTVYRCSNASSTEVYYAIVF